MKKIVAEILIGGAAIALGGLAVIYGLPLIQKRFEQPNSQVLQMSRTIAADLQKELPSGPGGEVIAKLYQDRQYRPFWLERDGELSGDGRKVAAIIAAAEEQGLPAGRYKLPPAPDRKAQPDILARYDIAFSRVALKYTRDMAQGALKPGALFDDADAPNVNKALPQELAAAANDGNAADYLAKLEPQGDYQRLKIALKQYRTGAEWPAVAAVKAKAPYPASLAPRLQAEGYLAAGQSNQAQLAEALKDWQAANGIAADGVLGKETAAALSISRRMRAAQIAANMERWRWLPRQLPARFIWVNVPSAQMVMIENGQSVLASRVVVGAPDKRTPLFNTVATAVTINPKWHIPKSIIENEIKPKQAQNSGYLEAHDITEEDGAYVQGAGPHNSLGAVKFEMQNRFDVYLHDTPAKAAFLNDDRALSHGCVRVQAIKPLALQVLAMSPEELDAQIATRETLRKQIKEPIPVFIQYWTAMPALAGKIGFRDDVYGRDARMIAAMQKLDV